MKTEKEIKEMIKEIKERKSQSANMNYEKGGATEALEWVLEERKVLAVGLR